MELLYLWINCSDHDCIIQQEFNFSPLYTFKVDDLKNPNSLFCEKKDTINLFDTTKDKGVIKNITAVVGANGAGKTTLLSFVANNSCFNKPERVSGSGYERLDTYDYECNKSIYVFYENNAFIVFHNLEESLTCDFDVLRGNLYWNSEDTIVQLCKVRKQFIIYLSNSSIVPESLLGYSQSDNTYIINLHQRSMNIVANRFYKMIFGKSLHEVLRENDEGFAWVIIQKRDERNFQEILDLLYYQYLLENGITDFLGVFKEKINVYFENIIRLIEDKYHDEFEIIVLNKNYKKYSKQSSNKEPSELSKEYFEKIYDFRNHYSPQDMEIARRKNCTAVLYTNLLFEAFFAERNFELPNIDFHKDIYEQLKELPFSKKYKAYLKDIKKVDDILCSCPMNENLIDNPSDLACSYEKVILKENHNFYKYIQEIFKERKSFVLRYIRVNNLGVSAGERAMQNLFSWLVLIPELDEIMGMKRPDYSSKLLLIDEIDLYAHPEWQRKMMSQLITTINVVEKKVPVQIIISSHSPFILSDFPRQNVIYMDRRNDKTIVDNNEDHKQSFGANIYTLLKEAFFLKNGAVGEFAKRKILEVYEELESSEHHGIVNDTTRKEAQLSIIDMIGDELVKHEMQRLFDKKYTGDVVSIPKKVPENLGELKKLKRQIETSLETVKKMIGDDRL